jgi:hypothetical protein
MIRKENSEMIFWMEQFTNPEITKVTVCDGMIFSPFK